MGAHHITSVKLLVHKTNIINKADHKLEIIREKGKINAMKVQYRLCKNTC
jgi:hypothetical protein